MLSLQDIVARTGAHKVHNLNITGKGVKVSILDSGIHCQHYFLKNSVIKKFQLAAGSLKDEVFGHGTHVASIVRAITPQASIINIKILDDKGTTTLSTIMEGIELAVDNKANVINISGGLGMDCAENHPLARLIDQVSDEVMVVCAVGNQGPKDGPSLPALARGCVAVGALTETGRTAFFSARGPACGRVWPDVVSWGENILGAAPPNDWKAVSGTSQAAPQVTGALALVREVLGRNLSRQEIEVLLQQSCDRLDSKAKSNVSGWGRLNIERMIDVVAKFK